MGREVGLGTKTILHDGEGTTGGIPTVSFSVLFVPGDSWERPLRRSGRVNLQKRRKINKKEIKSKSGSPTSWRSQELSFSFTSIFRLKGKGRFGNVHYDFGFGLVMSSTMFPMLSWPNASDVFSWVRPSGHSHFPRSSVGPSSQGPSDSTDSRDTPTSGDEIGRG